MLCSSFKVDGDSDGDQVLRELRRCVHREIASLRRERAVESIDEGKDVVGELVGNLCFNVLTIDISIDDVGKTHFHKKCTITLEGDSGGLTAGLG